MGLGAGHCYSTLCQPVNSTALLKPPSLKFHPSSSGKKTKIQGACSKSECGFVTESELLAPHKMKLCHMCDISLA